MTDNEIEQDGLASNHVTYDWRSPSDVFTREQIDYIEKINTILSPIDVDRVRSLEWVSYNKNVKGISYSLIPGLRGKKELLGYDQGSIYVKRYSKIKYSKMIDNFLSYRPTNFPKNGSGCYMPVYRMSFYNGQFFYPIAFFGELDAWRRRLNESAAIHHTDLAFFDGGTFVVSNGQKVPFADLQIELLRSQKFPKDW